MSRGTNVGGNTNWRVILLVFLGVRPAKSRRDCSWSITTAGAQEFLNSEVAFPHWRRGARRILCRRLLVPLYSAGRWTTDPQFADGCEKRAQARLAAGGTDTGKMS